MEKKLENDHDFSFLEEDANQKQKSVMAKHLKRRIKPYTSSRIKTRNFLSRVSYTGVKSDDFVDNNFTFNIITPLTKNVNPFSLERKISDIKNREIIYMLWDECIEKTFYKHICESENFIYLNSKNIAKHCKTVQIVLDYLNKDSENIILLRRCLQKHMKPIQFVYSRCFPDIYSLIDKQGINLKCEFLLTFNGWKDKKKLINSSVATTGVSVTIEKQNEENKENSEKELNKDKRVSEKLNEKKLKRKVLPEKNAA